MTDAPTPDDRAPGPAAPPADGADPIATEPTDTAAATEPTDTAVATEPKDAPVATESTDTAAATEPTDTAVAAEPEDAPVAAEPEDATAPVAAESEDQNAPLVAEVEDGGAPVAGEPVGEGGPVAGRPRRRLVVAGALVVALLAAGGVVAWRVLTPDPRDVAEQFFARLAAGDANGALKAVDQRPVAGAAPVVSGPLLTDAALSDAASRPQAMTITHVAQAGDTATMTVRYQANGAAVTQTLTAKRHGRAFALQAPLVRLSFANLAAGDKARVAVNGVTVDPAGVGPAFPGAYAVAADGNVLFAGRSATAVPAPDATATVTLPPPSLSADGRAKADAAVAAALQQCAANHFEPQPVCPEVGPFQPDAFTSAPPSGGPPITDFPIDSIVVTTIVTGEIAAKVTQLPVCTFTPEAGALDHVTFSSTGGVVHWDIKLSRIDGTLLSSQTSDVPIAPTGRVGLDADGRLQVTFA